MALSVLKLGQSRGTRVAQSVEHLTLDFGSGHNPGVVGSSPVSGSVLSVEPAWDSLSLCPSPTLVPMIVTAARAWICQVISTSWATLSTVFPLAHFWSDVIYFKKKRKGVTQTTSLSWREMSVLERSWRKWSQDQGVVGSIDSRLLIPSSTLCPSAGKTHLEGSMLVKTRVRDINGAPGRLGQLSIRLRLSVRERCLEEQKRRRQRATKKISTFIGTFLVCFAPYVITRLVELSSSVPIGSHWGVLSKCLAYSKAASDPFVYSLLRHQYRKSCKEILNRILHRRSLHSSGLTGDSHSQNILPVSE
ncbi:g-protein coupled receptor 26 [Lynx pardinus]|uniref:G-protein coupled receptor 26 n=1 Tax=Lynx pardinus TaxID=191816 RepID=A0A485P278_LYNPA|nr:g-protein coupled receptor 26 [Lynx pardinus]